MPYNILYVKSPALQDSVSSHFSKCKAIIEKSGSTYLNYHDLFGKEIVACLLTLGIYPVMGPSFLPEE